MTCKHELDWENSYRNIVQCTLCWDGVSISDYVNGMQNQLEQARKWERLWKQIAKLYRYHCKERQSLLVKTQDMIDGYFESKEQS